MLEEVLRKVLLKELFVGDHQLLPLKPHLLCLPGLIVGVPVLEHALYTGIFLDSVLENELHYGLEDEEVVSEALLHLLLRGLFLKLNIVLILGIFLMPLFLEFISGEQSPVNHPCVLPVDGTIPANNW